MSDAWGLHCCLLDRECRRDAGLVFRVAFHTPRWRLDVALRPKDRFVRADRSLHWIDVQANEMRKQK